MDEELAPETAVDDEGVDRTLIRWMLSLSVEERLDYHDQMRDFIVEVREQNGVVAKP